MNRVKAEEIKEIIKGDILINHPLKEYTSLKVGGSADLIVFPDDREDLIKIIRCLDEEQTPYFILGSGTNLLIGDRGVREVIISLSTGFNRLELIEGNKSPLIFAEAGVSLVSLVRFSVDHSLSGLEFACGIPGTVGGGIVMNAGGRLGAFEDVTQSITILNHKGKLITKTRQELAFLYRKLHLAPGSIVLSAIFQLNKGDQPNIKNRIRKEINRRKETLPLEFPNAGSIFKNPEGKKAGKLIDQAGLKGTQIGGARVSDMHANIIVNNGNATASDILRLIEEIKTRVYQKTGVMLEPEIKIVGEY
ncbi:MAG: UDP-N-acetylmuramate dehydrogenase [Thermodesulfobacteriota bacterium]|nr:UDP-N-acetylmuramate dehydrogenase [Thermodesulfobacteriota bacterium]